MNELTNVVWHWLKSWPVPVWSTIGGSAMTLMGVFFSDWRNTRRLTLQNNFSATQAERTRVMAIRKEVYLSAAGALAKMQAYLLSIPEPDTEIDPSPLLDFSEVIEKIAMVGKTETVLLAQKLSNVISEAQTALTVLASTVKVARSAVKDYERFRKKAQEQNDRVALEIDKFLEAGSVDTAQFEAMQRSRSRYQNEIDSHWDKEIAALREVSKLTNAFLAKALDMFEPISDASIALMVAIRDELGHETDAARLIAAARGHREQAIAQLRDLIKTADAERDAVEADRLEAES